MIKDFKKIIEQVLSVDQVDLSIPEHSAYGDYSCNIALLEAKKENIEPIKKAQDYLEKLQKNEDLGKYFSKIAVEDPGFINFYLSDKFLFDEARNILDKGSGYAKLDIGKREKVVVEYSSPNIAKSFSIGHLRSTVIGQAIFNLYESLGYEAIGDNHIGDWGTQFGAILYKVDSTGKDIDNLTLEDLESLYIAFNKEAEENPEVKDKAREWFKKLEDGDKKARDIWENVKNLSIVEFDRIYSLLGVDITHTFGESFYEDKMPAVIKKVREKGLSKKSDGAEIIEFDNLPPAMLVKSDGASTYFTRDLATLDFRINKWNPTKIIYEVGAEQILHFQQVFQAASMLGWSKNIELVHIPHGLVKDESGKKMSTRAGATIKLEEILNEAISRALKIVEESSTGGDIDKVQKKKIASAVGIGAIKYFDLIHQPKTDILFDWNKIFMLDGNSAPYLQYTFARINGVLADRSEITLTKPAVNLKEEEKIILRTLPKFKDVLVSSALNYSPNLLCNYLFDLSQKYNHFYSKHRILQSNNETFRIAISKATGNIIKTGLSILGIDTPERM